MKISIMQPYIFPYLGYFQMIHAVDKFVVLDDVQYIRKGWINKNRIFMNGNDISFVFPLKNDSSHLDINERFLADDVETFKDKFVKTLYIAYKRTPYFEEIMPSLSDMLYFKDTNLAMYVTHQIEEICKLIGINTPFVLSSAVNKNEDLKSQDLMIDICKKSEGEIYINAIGGQKLYSKEAFKKEGIELYFIQMDDIRYQQYRYPFIEKLSILDVLFFNGCKKTKEMLDRYKLI